MFVAYTLHPTLILSPFSLTFKYGKLQMGHSFFYILVNITLTVKLSLQCCISN